MACKASNRCFISAADPAGGGGGVALVLEATDTLPVLLLRLTGGTLRVLVADERIGDVRFGDAAPDAGAVVARATPMGLLLLVLGLSIAACMEDCLRESCRCNSMALAVADGSIMSSKSEPKFRLLLPLFMSRTFLPLLRMGVMLAPGVVPAAVKWPEEDAAAAVAVVALTAA